MNVQKAQYLTDQYGLEVRRTRTNAKTSHYQVSRLGRDFVDCYVSYLLSQECKGVKGVSLDIGGDPARDKDFGRKYVHSLVPFECTNNVLTDTIQESFLKSMSTNAKMFTSYCKHPVTLCDCEPSLGVRALKSVDSLYYMSDCDIVKVVNKYNVPLIASVTYYPDKVGVIKCGEESYVKTNGAVLIKYNCCTSVKCPSRISRSNRALDHFYSGNGVLKGPDSSVHWKAEIMGDYLILVFYPGESDSDYVLTCSEEFSAIYETDVGNLLYVNPYSALKVEDEWCSHLGLRSKGTKLVTPFYTLDPSLDYGVIIDLKPEPEKH
jgi:hypothetical protein